jgi:hypothetical protein
MRPWPSVFRVSASGTQSVSEATVTPGSASTRWRILSRINRLWYRRKMILSQSSAQSVASLSGAAETEAKRIVPHGGSASRFDPPRSLPKAEPRLMKKNKAERKYNFLPTGSRPDPGDWPVISLETSFEGETSGLPVTHSERRGSLILQETGRELHCEMDRRAACSTILCRATTPS